MQHIHRLIGGCAMCQESFKRAILVANQFLKHDMVEQVKQTLAYAHHYSDGLPFNTIIIADIQKRLDEKISRGLDNGY